MGPPGLVSICIPTSKGSRLFRDALESCFAQNYRPLEIVVGDDSSDEQVKEFLRQPPHGVTIAYERNPLRLGQAKNVNSLFSRANGQILLLLHDDDLLLPNAVAQLSSRIDPHRGITAAFGKQRLIAEDGTTLSDENLNKYYFRTSDLAGSALSAVASALVQQFPNDGFVVDARTAKEVGYSGRAGRLCDWDFGIRLATRSKAFFYLDEYTAIYRKMKHGEAKSKLSGDQCKIMHDMIKGLKLADGVEWARLRSMERLLPALIACYAYERDRRAIFDIMSSDDYRRLFWRRPVVIRHLAYLMFPFLLAQKSSLTVR